MSNTLLTVSGVTKSFKDVTALQHVDLQFDSGEGGGLVGGNGAGKTTLLNIISGLINPTKGQILFDNENITQKNPVERNIAQIFQFPVIYDTMTVFDNLAFPLRNRKIPEEEIPEEGESWF